MKYYFFKCRKCGNIVYTNELKKLKKMNDLECPECGEEGTENWLFMNYKQEEQKNDRT